MATMVAPARTKQVSISRRSPNYWRVTVDNPPINVMGPEMVEQFQAVIDALHEAKEHDLEVLLSCLRMKSPNDEIYYHAHGVATVSHKPLQCAHATV